MQLEEKKAEPKTGTSSKSNVQTLVVSGFASTTRASDIREAFRSFGKVQIAAKLGLSKDFALKLNRFDGCTDIWCENHIQLESRRVYSVCPRHDFNY